MIVIKKAKRRTTGRNTPTKAVFLIPVCVLVSHGVLLKHLLIITKHNRKKMLRPGPHSCIVVYWVWGGAPCAGMFQSFHSQFQCEVKAEKLWPKTWTPGPHFLSSCKIKTLSTIFTMRCCSLYSTKRCLLFLFYFVLFYFWCQKQEQWCNSWKNMFVFNTWILCIAAKMLRQIHGQCLANVAQILWAKIMPFISSIFYSCFTPSPKSSFVFHSSEASCFVFFLIHSFFLSLFKIIGVTCFVFKSLLKLFLQPYEIEKRKERRQVEGER